ncbi:MAG: hypothetical protein FD134_2765 [Gallionellaceae bacterium]|nr:MAG: hypothetical protein FD134_2765 [Gallionellaceae bacterium]
MRTPYSRALWFLVLLLSLPLHAQEPPPDLAAIVGTYHGEALNGGGLAPVTTVFRLASGNRLVGEYIVSDARGTFHGTISNAFFEDGKLSVEWTDRDGEGYAEFTFSPDFRSFEGIWASYDSPNGSPWSGEKE